MWSLFGPVEAGAHELASKGWEAELGKCNCASLAHSADRVAVDGCCSRFTDGVGNGHTEPACEMVVATAGVAHGMSPRPFAERGHRPDWGDTRDGLNEVSHVWASEAVVAMPAPSLYASEPGSDKTREMMACC